MVEPEFYDNRSDKYLLMDTTLRDGEQAPGVVLTPEEKATYFRLAVGAGLRYFEIGVPENVLDKECCEAVVRARNELDTDLRNEIRLAALALARPKSVESVIALGVDEVLLVVPCSDSHFQAVVHKSSHGAYLEQLSSAVNLASSAGLRVNVGLEDASAPDNSLLPIVLSQVVSMKQIQAVTISDTRGVLIPATLDRLLRDVRDRLSEFQCELAFHGHNDFGLATANAFIAVTGDTPVDSVHVTTCGFGERAGNSSLEQMVALLQHSVNRCSHISLAKLRDLSQFVSTAFLTPISPHAPVIGQKIFVHESSIHQRGILQDPANYQPIDPHRLGMETTLVIGKHTGRTLLRKIARDHNLKLENIESLRRKLAHVSIETKQKLKSDFRLIASELQECGFQAYDTKTLIARLDGEPAVAAPNLHASHDLNRIAEQLMESSAEGQQVRQQIRTLSTAQRALLLYEVLPARIVASYDAGTFKNVRRKFGAAYAIPLLVQARLRLWEKDAGAQRLFPLLRAIAQEALSWHANTHVAHVVVYHLDRDRFAKSNSGTEEAVAHACAIQCPRGQDPVQFEADYCVPFFREIENYVGEGGASIRELTHLGMRFSTSRVSSIYDGRENLDNLPQDGHFVSNHGWLVLPPDLEKSGSQAEYSRIISRHLGRFFLKGSAQQFEELHLASGSHLGPVSSPTTVTSAHLYVEYVRPCVYDEEYLIAMKDQLARLAGWNAIANLSADRSRLRSRHLETERHRKNLEDRLSVMISLIKEADTQASGIGVAIETNPWRTFYDWINQTNIMTSEGATYWLFGKRFSAKHAWTAGICARSLFFLVRATSPENKESLQEDQNFLKLWNDWGRELCEKDREFNPAWTCLARVGLITSPLERWLNESLGAGVGGVSPSESFKHGTSGFLNFLGQNDLNLLLLHLVMGASWEKVTPDLTIPFSLKKLRSEVVCNGLHDFLTALLSSPSRKRSQILASADHPEDTCCTIRTELQLDYRLSIRVSPVGLRTAEAVEYFDLVDSSRLDSMLILAQKASATSEERSTNDLRRGLLMALGKNTDFGSIDEPAIRTDYNKERQTLVAYCGDEELSRLETTIVEGRSEVWLHYALN